MSEKSAAENGVEPLNQVVEDMNLVANEVVGSHDTIMLMPTSTGYLDGVGKVFWQQYGSDMHLRFTQMRDGAIGTQGLEFDAQYKVLDEGGSPTVESPEMLSVNIPHHEERQIVSKQYILEGSEDNREVRELSHTEEVPEGAQVLNVPESITKKSYIGSTWFDLVHQEDGSMQMVERESKQPMTPEQLAELHEFTTVMAEKFRESRTAQDDLQ